MAARKTECPWTIISVDVWHSGYLPGRQFGLLDGSTRSPRLCCPISRESLSDTGKVWPRPPPSADWAARLASYGGRCPTSEGCQRSRRPGRRSALRSQAQSIGGRPKLRGHGAAADPGRQLVRNRTASGPTAGEAGWDSPDGLSSTSRAGARRDYQLILAAYRNRRLGILDRSSRRT